MSANALREKVDAALAELASAETSLEGLLRDLRVRPRAEKVTVTAVVEGAFVRLRSARSELALLQEMVGGSERAPSRRPSTARRKA